MNLENITNTYNEKILNFDYRIFNDDSLLRGRLGSINYLLSIHDNNKDEAKYLDKISCILELVLNNIENKNNKDNLLDNSTLLYGATGLSFILHELLERDLIETDYQDQINEIDSIIYQNSIKQINQNYFDYLGGPIANLSYFLNYNKEKQIIDNVFDNLMEIKKSTEKLFYTESDSLYTNGYNLGLKHGHLGILKVLLEYIERFGKNSSSLITELTTELLDNFITELDYSYQVKDINIFKYYSITENNNSKSKHQNNRLCWCNSDITLTYFLLKAGILLEDDRLLSLSKFIGEETVKRRTFDTTGVESHYFCHGSSGIAFTYDKLYLLSGNEHYLMASEYWHQRTFEYLVKDMNNEMLPEDLPWLRGGKLGSLLVVNRQYENSIFKLLL